MQIPNSPAFALAFVLHKSLRHRGELIINPRGPVVHRCSIARILRTACNRSSSIGKVCGLGGVMRKIAVLILVLALCAAQARAGVNGSIELFPFGIEADTGIRAGSPNFGACQATVTSIGGGLLGRLSFGVYARLAGATLAGISGAEFYLQGLETNEPSQLPAGWGKTITFPLGTVDIGSTLEPFTRGQEIIRRGNMTWRVSGPGDSDCQRDPLVLLGVVDLNSSFGFSTNFTNNQTVTVVGGAPPSNPAFTGPILLLCDNPIFTAFCVSGGQLIINPEGVSCPVAVEQVTWTQVKHLYR